MIYKTLKKVSNVCQLLDKRKFPSTKTVGGITFTKNGDGSYTANGIKTGSSYLYIQGYVAGNELKLKANHKYLILNGKNTEISKYSVWLVVGGRLVAESNSIILINKVYTPKRDESAAVSVQIHVDINTEVNNFVFKPQLFDLTEMYGAGHEPTTVEEFRQDFPEEMYDYSPHCFITSYKNCLTCKTKNLFDINSANVTIKVDGSFIPKVGHTSHFYSLNVTPGQIYTVSYYTTSFSSFGDGLNLSVQTGDYYMDGVRLFFALNEAEPNTYHKVTFTIPEGATKITFSCILTSYYRNFMIELGDTATDYVPYGHLTSYKKSLMCKTKNLLDIPLTQGYTSNEASTTKRTFTIGTYIVGLTRNNIYIPSNVISSNITKNSISFKNNTQSGYGVSVPFLLTIGNTYTVSCKADNNFYPSIGISYYKEDGTLISYTESEIITNNPVKSFTVPENTYYTLILFYGRAGNEYTFSNIQLELGDTATEYHPYGYL